MCPPQSIGSGGRPEQGATEKFLRARGIVLGTCVAVLLNLFYNGVLPKERALALAAGTSHGTE